MLTTSIFHLGYCTIYHANLLSSILNGVNNFKGKLDYVSSVLVPFSVFLSLSKAQNPLEWPRKALLLSCPLSVPLFSSP